MKKLLQQQRSLTIVYDINTSPPSFSLSFALLQTSFLQLRHILAVVHLMLVCTDESVACVKEINFIKGQDGLLRNHCAMLTGFLPVHHYCIANSHFPRIVGERERKWSQEEGVMKTTGSAPALTPFAGKFVYSMCWWLHEGAPIKRIPDPISGSLCSFSPPNRVSLPGHEGGGEWGSEVN